jgi:hypothetical protein
MLKPILCLLMLIGSSQTETLKKEIAPLQADVDVAVGSTGAKVFTNAKGAYLDNYGVVVMLEAMLEATRNPLFSAAPTRDQVRASVDRRMKDIKEKVSELLKERVSRMSSIGPTESLTVIVYISNTNPAEVPDLPSQIIFSVKKDAPAQVKIQDF